TARKGAAKRTAKKKTARSAKRPASSAKKSTGSAKKSTGSRKSSAARRAPAAAVPGAAAPAHGGAMDEGTEEMESLSTDELIDEDAEIELGGDEGGDDDLEGM